MDSFTQLTIICLSYLYGIIFYLLARYNFNLIKNLKALGKYFITLIFIIDIVIFYIYIVYHINRGIFHIYFLLAIFLGYLTMALNCEKVVKFMSKKFKKKL